MTNHALKQDIVGALDRRLEAIDRVSAQLESELQALCAQSHETVATIEETALALAEAVLQRRDRFVSPAGDFFNEEQLVAVIKEEVARLTRPIYGRVVPPSVG